MRVLLFILMQVAVLVVVGIVGSIIMALLGHVRHLRLRRLHDFALYVEVDGQISLRG